jgi:hypothetical protein
VTAVFIQVDKIVGRKRERDRQSYSMMERKFPWEPSDSTTEQGMIDVLKVKRAKRFSSEEQHQQLRFLASMTFSNGGVRSPSCPCCQ